ncbi:hypothetical protein M011DRAFT_470173 [Sporormia fimetaria CBS 119925]|uniref:DUF3074 domain-containing protein n=1 Tax=Sporormia fimetaria CBS 119925 TaxID=1340428 RepID=A0A6A6V311_9PLEO|nr:hypothetical protein M011DRAFT_470173 [Sporormia fimetaria CBS 119925]
MSHNSLTSPSRPLALLHKALEILRPRDYTSVPLSDLEPFLSDVFSKAELIANSVPPPPNGVAYDSATPTRTSSEPATSHTDLTISQVRRPTPSFAHAELQSSWGKPLKLSKSDAARGISVFKMAGHDRHGAWFARSSVHEGLGFSKFKHAMKREFPESLEVQGGPGEGNVRGIGGDKRLEDVVVEGLGRLEVYQLSAQFPGPVAPREFITLLLTSENALGEASKDSDVVPRHYMVVSIPVMHDKAPPRDGLVRGQYESVEMIREIPLPADGTTDRDPETNPVEWIMVTRSDPGGGIPRFMVERNTPSSIVQDAEKFLRWACRREDFAPETQAATPEIEIRRASMDTEPPISKSEGKGVLAGVGTSIVDDLRPTSFRRPSQRSVHNEDIVHTLLEKVEQYIPTLNRTTSHSSSSTSTSSDESFASAKQFYTANDGLPPDTSSSPTPSSTSLELSLPSQKANKELEKIEKRRQAAISKLQETQEKQAQSAEAAEQKTQQQLSKAAEKHARERAKQELKYEKEIKKLEARREKETKKLLERQKKEAEKTKMQKLTRERDEWKERAELAEKENEILQEQILTLQKENTAIVARVGRMEGGLDVLKGVKEDMEGGGKGRNRASSRASGISGLSGKSKEARASGNVSEA